MRLLATSDLHVNHRGQLDALDRYRPQKMNREQIVEAAKAVLARMDNPGPNQMGQVMKQMMAELKGRADGKLVQEVVRDMLK